MVAGVLYYHQRYSPSFLTGKAWGILYAEDAGIVSKSTEGRARMMIVIVTVFEAAGLTVSETILHGTPDQASRTSPPVIEAAGQRYKQATLFLDLGGLVNASADIMPEIKRLVRLA